MRKIAAGLRFLAFSAVCMLAGFTLSAVTPASPATRSGDYVVYRDYSWKSPTWIGFLYYDDFTYGAFVLSPETKSIVSLLFRVEPVDGRLVLTGQNIISKITETDVLAVNYLMTMLPDLYSWSLSSRKQGDPAKALFPLKRPRSSLLPSLRTQNLALSQFGGEVILGYAEEIPLFNLLGMSGTDGKAVLELVRMGRIQEGEESSFFGFSPVQEISEKPAFNLPRTRQTEEKTVDGVTFILDDQWTMVADNTFFLGDTAVLIIDTLVLGDHGIPTENLPLSLVRMFSLSNKSSWSIPSELSVTGTAKKFRIDNIFFDSGTGSINRDIKQCIPLAGGKCTIVSLSISETVYQANRSYFDSLLK